MQNIASLHTDEFPALLARLPPDLDLDQLATEHKAIQRSRKIKTGAELLRLARLIQRMCPSDAKSA
jgi:hypothetical protein